MNRLLAMTVLLGTVAMAIPALQAAEMGLPNWAYGIPPAPPPGTPPAAPVRDDGKTFSLPGTDRTFTLNKIRGRRDNDTPARVGPADWYPGDHPAMPKIVEEGDDARGIIACSLCHYPNGKGRPENAPPAGQPKEYIVQQLLDMKNGLRKSAETRKANTNNMINFAKAMTSEEIEASANYFASMAWTPWIKVVESATAPKTRIQAGMFLKLDGAMAGTEPLGNRVIETPDDADHTETLRDPRSPFTAYVPIGAIAKGQNLVRTGGAGKTIQCTVCHGEDLHGIGSVPGIAARSPSYIARQMYDIKNGARNGAMAALMKPVVAKLTDEDIVNIVAYTASLPAARTSTAQR